MRWVPGTSTEYLLSVLEIEGKKITIEHSLQNFALSLKVWKTLEILTAEWNFQVWIEMIQLDNRRMGTQERDSSMDNSMKAWIVWYIKTKRSAY